MHRNREEVDEKMIPAKRTARQNVLQKVSWRTRRGRRVVQVQLCDVNGQSIAGALGQYTSLPGEADESAERIALLRAFAKLDQILEVKPFEDAKEVTNNFFSDLWGKMSDDEKISMVGESHKDIRSRKKAKDYFEANVINKLDKCYENGMSISPDDAADIARGIYIDILGRKKYNKYFVSELEAALIPEFFDEMGKRAAAITEIKGTDKERLDCFLKEVKETVMQEDRLRSLLQYTLCVSGLDMTVDSTVLKIEKNPVLLDDLFHLTHREPRTRAMGTLLEMIREISGDENRSKAEANVHIRDANDILRNWAKRSKAPFPLVKLPEFDVSGVMQIELCKELPWAVCVRFAALEMAEAAISPYACGAITMLTTGPRVAEVCAIQFGDILDFGDWGVVVINYTADGEIRIGHGKNLYFHRTVFLCRLAMDAIHARMDYLKRIGYSPDELKTAYIVCSAEDIFQPANLHLFSDSVKEKLQQAGCGEDYWRSVLNSMVQEPDFDCFGRREMFDTAYCLRRNMTSQCVNKAKMEALLVDAILGHRLPNAAKRWDDYITIEDNWPRIIAIMERVVYDPRHSNHPAYRPIDLQDNTKMNERLAVPYQAVTITTTGTNRVRVKLAVKTIIGSEVSVDLPSESVATGRLIRIVNEKDREGKILMSEALRGEDEYRTIIQQMERDSGK